MTKTKETIFEDLNSINKQLLQAVKASNAESVKNLVNIDNANYTNPETKRSLLFTAIFNITDKKVVFDVAEILLNNGANPNTLTSSKGYAPIHYAVEAGLVEIIKLLIEKKALIDLKTKSGHTSLQGAIAKINKFEKCYKIAKFLIENGADTSILTEKNKNLLLIIENIRNNKIIEAVKLIKDKQIDITILHEQHKEILLPQVISLIKNKQIEFTELDKAQKDILLNYAFDNNSENFVAKLYKDNTINSHSLDKNQENKLLDYAFKNNDKYLIVSLIN